MSTEPKSSRARRVSRAYLDQIIREEIEKQVKGAQTTAPALKVPFETTRPAGFWCERCREVFESMGQLLAHDLAAHADERIARMEARLREREPKAMRRA